MFAHLFFRLWNGRNGSPLRSVSTHLRWFWSRVKSKALRSGPPSWIRPLTPLTSSVNRCLSRHGDWCITKNAPWNHHDLSATTTPTESWNGQQPYLCTKDAKGEKQADAEDFQRRDTIRCWVLCVESQDQFFATLQLKKLGKTREVSHNQPRRVFPLTLAERILGASNNASLNFEPPIRKFASRVIPKQYIES